jgi:release factor glutamine methyltransferase
MSTLKESLQTARNILISNGIADADVDAWYLLAHVMGMNRAEYLLHREDTFPEDLVVKFEELVQLRAEHIPLQHITGSQEFMGLEFAVNENVLIPRQDTELLVEEVLKVCEDKSVLDLCTGSGCIIISLAKLGKPVQTVAVDISEKALQVAARNAQKHGVGIELIKSDLYEKVNGAYDIIVSNPPYIRTEEVAALMPEVRDHEPYIALEAGPDGLVFYRRIIEGLAVHLKKGGMVFFEIGHDQAEAVTKLLVDTGYTEVTVKKDLSGLDRVVSARRP